MDYAQRLVLDTEGERGLAERGYYGEAEREAEIERQRCEYEAYQRDKDNE